MLAAILWSILFLFLVGVVTCQEQVVTLNNGNSLPLIGMGVGNLPNTNSSLIVDLIQTSTIELIDTAHASQNEHLVRQGVERRPSHPTPVHVVTKIWYTYLGYERTLISVRESLQALQHPDIRVHLLLHWPYCNDDIEWMDCEQEENALPHSVKEAGPPPHLDKENAWKESWRALEDIYSGDVKLGDNLPTIQSIGVSNFNLQEVTELAGIARIPPSIFQGNVWTYVFDPDLMAFLDSHGVHFQAYNVMNGIFWDPLPNALECLEIIGQELSATPSQVVLKWLVSNDVSVIPRTSNLDHLKSNADLHNIPELTVEHEKHVLAAVKALLQGHDLEPPVAQFHNKHDESIHVYWKSEEGEEHPVKLDMEAGSLLEQRTYPGHTFLAYNQDRTKQKVIQIPHVYGETVEIHVEL